MAGLGLFSASMSSATVTPPGSARDDGGLRATLARSDSLTALQPPPPPPQPSSVSGGDTLPLDCEDSFGPPQRLPKAESAPAASTTTPPPPTPVAAGAGAGAGAGADAATITVTAPADDAPKHALRDSSDAIVSPPASTSNTLNAVPPAAPAKSRAESVRDISEPSPASSSSSTAAAAASGSTTVTSNGGVFQFPSVIEPPAELSLPYKAADAPRPPAGSPWVLTFGADDYYYFHNDTKQVCWELPRQDPDDDEFF